MSKHVDVCETIREYCEVGRLGSKIIVLKFIQVYGVMR